MTQQKQTTPLLSWPIADCMGRKRKAAVVASGRFIELVFTGSGGGIVRCAVHPRDAFKLLAALCGRHRAALSDVHGRCHVRGVGDELHIRRRYLGESTLFLDAAARAVMRAQIARAVRAAEDWPVMPKPRGHK